MFQSAWYTRKWVIIAISSVILYVKVPLHNVWKTSFVIQELQALEKRLEADIARENNTRTQANQKNPSVSSPNQLPIIHGNRVVFGALSEEELVRRSSPSFNPRKVHSPSQKADSLVKSRSPRGQHSSPRLKGCGSPRFQRALSPLVKDGSRKHIRPCHKFAVAKDVLDASIDIITVPATESDASILAPSNRSLNSSVQSSPLQSLSPNVLNGDSAKWKSLSATYKYAAGNTLEQQVINPCVLAAIWCSVSDAKIQLLVERPIISKYVGPIYQNQGSIVESVLNVIRK